MADALIKLTYDWDWSGADAAVQRALALEPGNAAALNRAGVLACTLGRFDEGLQLDRRAAALDPLRAATWVNLGLCAGRSGKWEESAAALEKALELTPGRPGAHAHLGRILLAQSRPQEALTEIEQETSPVWRMYGLALAYHALGRRRKRTRPLPSTLRNIRRMPPTRSPRFTRSAATPTAPSNGWSGHTRSATADSLK